MKKRFKKIYIEITNICNLNCKFCLQDNRQKEYMDISNFEKIILQIKDYTDLVCLHVKGEPLLHKNLGQILNILEKYSLKTNITTNGILIKDKLEILKNSKAIRQINFSIHSITQNKNINCKEYLKNIFESSNELARNSDIKISYRLWNLTDLNNNTENNEIINFIQEFYYLNNLKENLQSTPSVKLCSNVFINQDTIFEWPNLNNDIILKHGRCLALKEQIAILVDGTVVPCCLDNDGTINLGNIYETNLEEILNSERASNIIKNFQTNLICEELCKKCGFLKRLEEKRKK